MIWGMEDLVKLGLKLLTVKWHNMLKCVFMLNVFIFFPKHMYYIQWINRIQNSNSKLIFSNNFQFNENHLYFPEGGNTDTYHWYFPGPVLPGKPWLDYIKAQGFNLYFVNDESKVLTVLIKWINIKIMTSVFQLI